MKPLPPVLIGLVTGFLAFQVTVLVNWPLALTIALGVYLGIALAFAGLVTCHWLLDGDRIANDSSMRLLREENDELKAKLSRSHLRRGKRGRFISRSPRKDAGPR